MAADGCAIQLQFLDQPGQVGGPCFRAIVSLGSFRKAMASRIRHDHVVVGFKHPREARLA
jgi:hypothetical protein